MSRRPAFYRMKTKDRVLKGYTQLVSLVKTVSILTSAKPVDLLSLSTPFLIFILLFSYIHSSSVRNGKELFHLFPLNLAVVMEFDHFRFDHTCMQGKICLLNIWNDLKNSRMKFIHSLTFLQKSSYVNNLRLLKKEISFTKQSKFNKFCTIRISWW